MAFNAPYRQHNYMGEHPNDASALAYIQSCLWDSNGDGTGDPRSGMWFYETTVNEFHGYKGNGWYDIGGALSLGDIDGVGSDTATAGNVLIGDGDSWESKAISGAISVGASGAAGFVATAETTADDADLIVIHDDSASEYKRMTRANFLAGSGVTDEISEGNTSIEVVDTGSDGHAIVTVEGSEAGRFESGAFEQDAPASAPTISRNSALSLYIDETSHNLKVAVKYSDGTVKTATLAFD